LKNQINAPEIPNRAIPPTTPPAMAPVSLEFFGGLACPSIGAVVLGLIADGAGEEIIVEVWKEDDVSDDILCEEDDILCVEDSAADDVLGVEASVPGLRKRYS